MILPRRKKSIVPERKMPDTLRLLSTEVNQVQQKLQDAVEDLRAEKEKEDGERPGH